MNSLQMITLLLVERVEYLIARSALMTPIAKHVWIRTTMTTQVCSVLLVQLDVIFVLLLMTAHNVQMK